MQKNKKMAPFIRREKQNNSQEYIGEVLDKGENSLSDEEVHFIQTCC
jgi:hypothetical protein